MEARFEENFMGATWRIWLYRRTHSGLWVVPPVEEGVTARREVHVGESARQQDELKPTLELREEEIEAIVKGAMEQRRIMPPNLATAEHLADARETRDRLLGMVERGHEAVPLDGGYALVVRPPE